ncbi:hypothetical protein P8452_52867 [Trifolium repens]|nr:hypothetical protein P8452_52867 [Trifolium repens]
MRQNYHNPLFKTSFPIEEHVASILTPYAFELLQHEIELSTKYAATQTVCGYIVRHHTKVDGGRLTIELEQFAIKELEKVIRHIKGMRESQDNLIDLQFDVPNNDDCEVENPPVSKMKGRPKRSRPKGGVEVAKALHYHHVPNCHGTDHDTQNCPNKNKSIEVLPSQSPIKSTNGWRQSSSNI